MGSGESTTRKVSFGVDDEDRVRILRGVKLSEDVLQRMRGVANIAPEPTFLPTSSPQKDTGVPRSASSGSGPPPGPQHQGQPGTQSSTSKPASFAKEEQKRYERQKTLLKEEWVKVAQREREAAREEMTKAMTQERQQKRQEAENAKHLAQQLQKKDLQLKALDNFYKEQLTQLEKRNLERYEQSKDEFHQAASKTEESVRSRNTDPVCLGLQAQILSCYRDNRDQTLRCSDLAKEYMRCINAAKKNLLVNHG
ncbi:MICOS complex subunit mic25a-like isoform X1 [Cyclopterus lumpus]|uniref:Coiled-coil-helix-coiled-coil-helix domain containing 6a n=1 Tax=Cyclopterus lumpus TaxID=8103 RepID=A0A8C2W765_CYCLU|nr:MICOS complex subunit mic25a-like isoform X1 [Cyclopterus lumpus]